MCFVQVELVAVFGGTSHQDFLHVNIAMIPPLVGSFLSSFSVLVRRYLLFNVKKLRVSKAYFFKGLCLPFTVEV